MSIRVRMLAAVALLAGTVVLANPLPAAAATFTVDVTTDSVDSNPGDGICDDGSGACSLRAGIQEANASAGADTINLPAGNIILSIAGPGEDSAATGDIDVTSEITIFADAAGTNIANGADDRIFDVSTAGNLSINGTILVFGTATDAPSAAGGGSGGAVRNAGIFSATTSGFQENTALRAGGAIEASPGSTTTIVDSTFLGNTTGSSPGNGGAVHITGAATVNITGGSVLRNIAESEGGGLWASSAGTLMVDGVSIDENEAKGPAADNGGGAIFNDGGTLNVSGSTFTYNRASGAQGSGGGVFNGGVATISDTVLDQNSAQRAGGGIEAIEDSFTSITDGRLGGNDAGTNPGNGGGLHVSGAGTVNVTGTAVQGNRAANEGGGLWNSAVGTMTLNNAYLVANSASGPLATNGGGGIFNQPNTTNTGGGSLTLTGTTITVNSADGAAGSGGGLFNGGSAIITGSDITGNDANRAGAGIEAVGGSTTSITRGRISENEAGSNPGNGGGLHVGGDGIATIDASVVEGNAAANEGAGLWVSGSGSLTIRTTQVNSNNAENMGGGLYNDGGMLLAQNSLVYDNVSEDGGGVHAANGGSTTLQHVTLVTNDATTGSGVSADPDSTITLNNSIVSANTGGADCAGTIVSTGGNVTGGCSVAGPGDLTGVGDPMLSGSFVPQPGSAAIDNAVQANSLPTDFYSTARPLDGDSDGTFVSDSGAVEAPGDAPPTSTTTTTTSTTTVPGVIPTIVVGPTTVPGATTSTTAPADTTTSVSTPATATSAPPGSDSSTPGATTPGGDIQGDQANQGNSSGLVRTGSGIISWTLVGLSLLTMGAITLLLLNRRRLTSGR